MNGFDYTILSYFSRFTGVHPAFDQLVVALTDDGLAKGGVIVALLWWAWFKDLGTPENSRTREHVVAAIVACAISIVMARLLVLAFPFRIRPLADPTNGLHFPAGTHNWENWSSFPSDNAILYFTLTTTFFFISRRAGLIALFDSVFLVCLPRIYLGIHHPTDILAGAFIGVVTGVTFSQRAIRHYLSRGTLRWMNWHPSSFYTAFFVFCYEIITSFSDVRLLLKAGLKLVKHLFGHG